MGKDLAEQYGEARAVFDEVDEALGTPLSKTMFEGPDETLRLTENAQPALMAVSLATMRVLEGKGVTLSAHANYVAGHSLGEYSALCAAGSFSIAEAARLLQIRGRAMQQAVPVGEGAMAAILGLEFDVVTEIAIEARQGSVCDVANDNAPGQIVVSGAVSAVQRAIEIAKGRGAKRAILLPVSAPFHCALMAPAAERMQAALSEAEISAPSVPLVANVLAQPISDPAEIRRRLVEQVTGMVRWSESVQWLVQKAGVAELAEIGTGKVLSGLARRISRDTATLNAGTAADIDAFVEAVTKA